MVGGGGSMDFLIPRSSCCSRSSRIHYAPRCDDWYVGEVRSGDLTNYDARFIE